MSLEEERDAAEQRLLAALLERDAARRELAAAQARITELEQLFSAASNADARSELARLRAELDEEREDNDRQRRRVRELREAVVDKLRQARARRAKR